MEKKEEILKWDSMSNVKIQHELESIKQYHTSLKLQINKLLDKIDELEKEYNLSNTIINNRKKGID